MPKRFSRFEALAVRDYRLAFLSQVSSQTGMWFRNFAVSLVVIDITHSAGALAWVTAAQFAPMLALGPLAGAVADRFPPRLVLQATNLASLATGVAFLAIPLSADWLPALYGILLFGGIAQTFERPASYALISVIVPAPQFQGAVSLHTVAVSVARFAGPALAGSAYTLAGPRLCFAANTAGYLLVAVCLLLMTSGRQQVVLRGSGPTDRGGIPGSRLHPQMVSLLAASAVVTLFAFNFNVTVTSMVALEHQGTAGAVGWAHALNAVGAIAGGVVVSGFRSVRIASLIPACVVLALALFLAGVTWDLTTFLIISPVLGLAIGLYQGVLHTAAQTSAAPDQRGRVASFVTMSTFGLMPVSALFSGWVIDVWSAHVSLLIGASACLIGALLVAVTAARPRAPRN
jgi:MFS family permease